MIVCCLYGLSSSTCSPKRRLIRVGVAASTVRVTIKRFQAAGLSWPLPAEMTDAALEARLFAAAGTKQGHRRGVEPDWTEIHRELKRKHVTLSILWDEYIERNPKGYRYSRFCELYRSWEGKLSVTMRQTHMGGDKLFVDYAGDTVPVIVDRQTRQAQIFVAVLGASNFTYAEAIWTQGLSDWIGAHTRAFAAIGAVPRLLVPDNAKVAVIKACLYEPQVNRTYAEMAAHYGTAVLPTRPQRPRDKAKVEAAVLIVERWILARLRHRRFYSLAELNGAIAELLKRLNDEKPLRRLSRTRRQLLEEHTGSISPATACAGRVQTRPPRIDGPNCPMQEIIRQRGAAPWATSCRNPGRLHLGKPGRLHRNPHAGRRPLQEWCPA